MPTYLGAHALPAEYRRSPDDYIDEMTRPELLRRDRRRGSRGSATSSAIAGRSTVEQARRVLKRARAKPG
jgi:hypothetical protein